MRDIQFTDIFELLISLLASAMVFKKMISLNFAFLFIASVMSSDLRLILPLDLKVREGEDLQLRLTNTLPETISCYVKTPLLTSYNLMSQEPDSENRINYWTENGECGVRAKNVTKKDAGRWRLTAKNSTNTIVNSVTVQILDKVHVPESNVSIQSGLGYTLILNEESKYCRIKQPHSDDTPLVNGDCKIDLNQPTAAVQGTWTAMTGVVGQLEEVLATAQLNVYRDRLVTGFTKNSEANTINAYCNLRDADKGLEFCSFGKPGGAKTGFQLSEGLHSGRYGYYGAGLETGECGITIETPTAEDYGQWHCSVGVKDEEPFGSYIQIYDGNHRNAGSTVLAQALPTSSATTFLGDKLQLRCETTVPIRYCWFLAPDGEIFAPRQSVTTENPSWRYIGEGFGRGQCGIEIKTAEQKHNGQWKCHIGPEVSGFEITSEIDAKITVTPLAATKNHIIVPEGGTLTIECSTVPDRASIDYCRFLMPDGTGLHISDDVTENNPLQVDDTRYQFSGLSLRLGGCGLKVDKISSKHIGKWTCAARLAHIEDNSEAFDTINVERGEPSSVPTPENQSAATTTPENLTAAATTGIVSGVLITVFILAAGSVYLVKRFKAMRSSFNVDNVEIVSIPPTSRRTSSSSSTISSTTSSQVMAPSIA